MDLVQLMLGVCEHNPKAEKENIESHRGSSRGIT